MKQFIKLTQQVLKLTREIRSTNEIDEKLRRFNENFKQIDEQLKPQRRNKSTTNLGYQGDNKIEEGETSKAKILNNDRTRSKFPKGKGVAKPTHSFLW